MGRRIKKLKKIRIHREGTDTLIYSVLAIGLVAYLLYHFVDNKIPFWSFAVIFGAAWLVVLNFYRCPIRFFEDDTERLVVAPADGKIVVIEEVMENEYFHEKRLMISIFMSLFNVHANWFPVDGKVKKVNMKNDSILSAGVYPAWHPWLKLIAYSTNKTMQSFHTRDINKIEVFDSQSDLIIYDVDKNEVTNIENDSTEFECYPAWSPDGKWLYYVSAHFEFCDTIPHEAECIKRSKEIKYSIYRKSFNPETMQFGPREMVFDAASLGKSATLPRISPDGKYLLFSMGEWGCFHIWHRDADLYMLRLADNKVWPLTKTNSPQAESFHNFSSNGKWIIFSSRRNDGDYTRLFFAHVDADGNTTKAFELPQQDPDFHRMFMKSYNIPEFMRGPVTIKPQEFADVLRNDNIEPVKYRSKK